MDAAGSYGNRTRTPSLETSAPRMTPCPLDPPAGKLSVGTWGPAGPRRSPPSLRLRPLPPAAAVLARLLL